MLSRYHFDEEFHCRSFSTNRDVVPMHGCHDMSDLDAPLPHAWARDPSRQHEIAECRCKLFLPILCSVARDVQAKSRQPAHAFVTCLVIFWRQFLQCPPSCWSVEVRPSHVHQCHNFFPVAASDNTISSASSARRRRVQLWPCACDLYSFATHLAPALGFPGCPLSVAAYAVLMGALPVSRRHASCVHSRVHLVATNVYSTSSRHALAHCTRSSHPPLLSSQCQPSHSSCSS